MNKLNVGNATFRYNIAVYLKKYRLSFMIQKNFGANYIFIWRSISSGYNMLKIFVLPWLKKNSLTIVSFYKNFKFR